MPSFSGNEELFVPDHTVPCQLGLGTVSFSAPEHMIPWVWGGPGNHSVNQTLRWVSFWLSFRAVDSEGDYIVWQPREKEGNRLFREALCSQNATWWGSRGQESPWGEVTPTTLTLWDLPPHGHVLSLSAPAWDCPISLGTLLWKRTLKNNGLFPTHFSRQLKLFIINWHHPGT